MAEKNNIIKVNNLTKKFGNFTACDSISFNVEKGEIFGFLGANGAGKTTAIKMLSGLLKPTSGEAEVAGFNIYKDTRKIKFNIGYMSQKFTLYEDLTVLENIKFYGGIYRLPRKLLKQKAGKIIEEFNLEKVKNKLIKFLPIGWKQRLAFAISTIHDPLIVFLDEPTAGVDPITRRKFWEQIYEAGSRGITIFVTTHYMDEAEYCGRVSIMVDGRVEAIDTPANLKQTFDSANMNEVFLKVAAHNKNKKEI